MNFIRALLIFFLTILFIRPIDAAFSDKKQSLSKTERTLMYVRTKGAIRAAKKAEEAAMRAKIKARRASSNHGSSTSTHRRADR